MIRLGHAACILLSIVGCCGYSTRSLLPSHLRTVSVMPADNITDQPGLGENLADALVDALASDRTLRQTNVGDANLVISTTVDGYSRNAASYTGDQDISVYELVVSARVIAQDKVKDEEFYSGTVSARTTYDPGSKTEEQAASETIARLASEIVRRILTAW